MVEIVFLPAPVCFGQFTGLEFEKVQPRETPRGFDFDFEVPNETMPTGAIPIIREAPEGVYVTVGTERGFLATAAAKNVTHLLLLDYSPNVVYFNRINTLLLKLSRHRDDYVHLRLSSDRSTWIERAAGRNLLPHEREILSDPRSLDWWQRAVRNHTFNDLHVDPAGRDTPHFRDVNYLYIDEQFEKLQALALEGKIEAHRIDLTDAVLRLKIVNELIRRGTRLSVFDASNAWWRSLAGVPYYMGPRKFSEVLHDFMKAGSMDSLLLHTHTTLSETLGYVNYLRAVKKLKTERSKKGATRSLNKLRSLRSWVKWTYHGYTFQHIASIGDPLLFVNMILLGKRFGDLSPPSSIQRHPVVPSAKTRILAWFSNLLQ